VTAGHASLTRGLIESHLSQAAGRGRPIAPAGEIALRVDHALMDADAASLVFQSFESSGAAGVAGDMVLACAEWPMAPPAFEMGDELRYVQSAARRYGVHFSRAGNGRAHHVYVARFAAPGRTLLSCASGSAAAGAMGTLALPVSEVELAAALAGVPHATPMPEVWAIRLAGTLPPGVGAHDLVMALARRLPGPGSRPVALEYCGSGVATLTQEQRFTVARLGAELGLPPAVFPSDDVTRGWLKAQGREPDWKPLAGDPEADAVRMVQIHLDTLEPKVVRTAEGTDPLQVREVVGVPVVRVVLGADAGLADLLLVAGELSGRQPAAGVELVVVPGSRQIRAMLGASGALGALSAAGARIVDAEARLAPGSSAGVILSCGASRAAFGPGRTVFRVGPAVAAASALAGRIADPREMPASAASFSPPDRFAPCEVVPPRPPTVRVAIEIVRGPAIRPLPSFSPLITALRGVVLQRFPDRMSTDLALSAGPRVWRHRGDPTAMAAHLYAGLDPTFAARARVRGGGFVVAGADFGIGPHRPHVVLAMVALGIRAVIATSFAPGHRAEMIRHGVLPLRPAADMEPGELMAGDELEIPGLPDMLERNKPLVVRNLTHGTQISLHHDLSEREIELVRAGGLLAARARAVAAADGPPGRAGAPDAVGAGRREP
jgi:homoaconitase/3-isopropylmalate dehydratase large subunit/3-isopropylmalate dehydratase small subunit